MAFDTRQFEAGGERWEVWWLAGGAVPATDAGAPYPDEDHDPQPMLVFRSMRTGRMHRLPWGAGLDPAADVGFANLLGWAQRA